MTMTSTPKISRNALAHLLMFAVVMLWGATFVLVKDALAHIAPQWFNALRMMLAFACLAALYRSQWRQLTRRAWRIGAIAGACIATGYFFQTQGLLYTTPTNSAFITALVVVLVPFLASLPVLRPPGTNTPGWSAWMGAMLAFLGVALLTTPAHTPWAHLLSHLNRGDLLTFGCALGFALHVITLAHGTAMPGQETGTPTRGIVRVRFEQIALLQIGFAMVFLTLGACVLEPPAAFAVPHWNSLVILALLVTGILATAVAFSVQTWAQQVIPATNIAVILTLEPVFAWLTAFLVLHEKLELRRTLGACLVLAGILMTELLPRWQKLHKS